MRKVTKPKKVCKHCGSVLKYEECEEFCDYCKEKIPKDVHFDVSVFWKGDSPSQRQEFCSLKCARQWLLEFPWNKKEVEFISLPYVDAFNVEDFLIEKKMEMKGV